MAIQPTPATPIRSVEARGGPTRFGLALTVIASGPRRHPGQIRFVCSHSAWQETHRVEAGSASSLSSPMSLPQSSHFP
jgi:hypothetical protein